MSWTIYHNPKCGTSRKVLARLQEVGLEPKVVEYLKTPPSREELVGLLDRMGISIRQLLRRRGTPYDDLGLDDPKWSDDQLIDFVGQHPILMERPVVDAGSKARLCRPVDEVETLITEAK